MKKFVLIITAVLMLCGCGAENVQNTAEVTESADSAQQDEQMHVWSQESGKIVVGLPVKNEPLSYMKDKSVEFKGFDVDFITACADKMGLDVEFKIMDWDNRHLFLNSANADIIFTSTADTKTKMIFTRPLLDNDKVILTHMGGGIEKLEDLESKKIACYPDDSVLDKLAADNPDVKFADSPVYENASSAMAQFLKGGSDALIADELFVRYYMEKNDCDVSVLQQRCCDDDYAIAASSADGELIEKLQAAIDQCIADGTAGSISSRWFGDDYILD